MALIKIRLITLLAVLFHLCSSLAALSEQQAIDPLRGPAFSDPDVVQKMPDDWNKKPIQYKESVNGSDLIIDLNQQIYPLLLPTIQQYAREHNLKIEVTEGTCGKSGGQLGRKEVDMGSFCCPPAEVDRLPGLRFHTLGVMPLSILIHPDNPIDDLTLDQVRKIFMGDVLRWSEMGGSNQLIKTIGSIHCQLKPGDWRLLLANEDLFGPRLLEVGDMPDMIAHVASNVGAIGYEVMLVAERFQDRGKVKPLKIGGLDPRNLLHLETGKYPFYRTFDITTWEGKHLENKHAQKIVDLLLERVEKLDQRYGLIPPSQLKKAGWQFKGSELVGEPKL